METPFGYWFERERRFVSAEERERNFDDGEAEALLVPLFTRAESTPSPTDSPTN